MMSPNSRSPRPAANHSVSPRGRTRSGFSRYSANKIGRITVGGVISEYLIPTALAFPQAITTGPDGALWFTEAHANKIGRITTAGDITEYTVGFTATPYEIVVGPDGALWFGADTGIGRAQVSMRRTGALSHIAAGGAGPASSPSSTPTRWPCR